MTSLKQLPKYCIVAIIAIVLLATLVHMATGRSANMAPLISSSPKDQPRPTNTIPADSTSSDTKSIQAPTKQPDASVNATKAHEDNATTNASSGTSSSSAVDIPADANTQPDNNQDLIDSDTE